MLSIPPEGEETMRGKLANWGGLFWKRRFRQLIIMAAAHYQFEAIHPVYRTAAERTRAYWTACCDWKRALDLPILYLSRYIIIETGRTITACFLGVTERQDWGKLDNLHLRQRMRYRRLDGGENRCDTPPVWADTSTHTDTHRNLPHELVNLLFWAAIYTHCVLRSVRYCCTWQTAL